MADKRLRSALADALARADKARTFLLEAEQALARSAAAIERSEAILARPLSEMVIDKKPSSASDGDK